MAADARYPIRPLSRFPPGFKRGGKKFLPNQTGNYQYDFQTDVGSQRTGYAAKLDAKFSDDIADEVRMARILRMPAPRAQQTQTRVISHVLGTGGATLPMQSLEPLHYVSCYVDLESLRQGKPLIPEFGELIKWVCSPESNDGRPKIGKLRLNCHGAGEYNAGLLMGKSNLGPEALVDALLRHGLTTRSMQFSSTQQNAVGQTVSWKERSEGGAVTVRTATARWKADNEANACENEKCKKQFTFVRRKHHCRRCGGIFCDACTTKRKTLKNPLTENGPAAGSLVSRVCDACAFEAEKIVITDVKAGKGLAQITLAMCLGARTKEEFSIAKTGFVRNSVGQRMAKYLSTKGVHGIQLSASNEVVAFSSGHGGFVQKFGVIYPGMSKNTKPTGGLLADPFEGTGFAGFVDVARESVSIPSSVLGGPAEPNFVIPPIINNSTYREISDQKLVPIHGGNAIAFGVFAEGLGRATERLVKEAFGKWRFDCWDHTETSIGTIPELTRFAADSAALPTMNINSRKGQPTRSQSTPTPVMRTIKLSAMARGVTIARDPRDPTRLVVSGMEERRYKDHKIIELT
jgi:hypothetical protein